MGTPLKVVVVGAGPAGVRAAEILLAAGIKPTVIDEGMRAGGQIYRQQGTQFTRSYTQLYGTEAAKAQDLHQSFMRLLPQIDYRPNTLAWNIYDGQLYVQTEGRSSVISYDALLLCTGATDRLMPVPGWDLAGTYSLGGAQVALKSQACAIGHEVVFMGTGPLLYLVAYQYVKAGAKVAAVLDTSPSTFRYQVLRRLAVRPRFAWNGLRMIAALKRAGVRLFNGITPQQIQGDSQEGVTGVSFLDRAGKPHKIECDAVGMGYHLRPETQLADLAKCRFQFDQATRQWLPEVDADGRSSVADVYLAGDGKAIAGADAAEVSGQLAAYALLQDRDYPVDLEHQQRLYKQRDRLEAFKQGLLEAFPWPARFAAQLPDETVVCRCECITAGELRRVCHEMGAQEANRAKAFSRVGMGRCQGRFCANAGAEVIAAAANIPVEQVGRLRGQAPVKPLAIAVWEENK